MPPWLRFLLALLIFGAAVYASHLVGVPHDAKGKEDLPDVAMDWRLLFHVLRASALLGALGIAGLIAWRGAHGEWPIKFGQVEYAPKEAVAVTADALAKQDQRLEIVEAILGLDPPELADPEN